MLSILLIVLPIFALIFTGWAARRADVLGPQASSELNRFVVSLSLPALLFDIVANAHTADIWRPGFIGAFGLGATVVFLAALGVARARRRPLADAAVDALNAAYPNTGYMGFPLMLAAFGPAALAPTLIATILTACITFAGAIALIEVGLQAESHPLHLARKVALSLARNPLLVAPALGALCLVLGIAVPGPIERFLKLLGSAASPCALVALGLFLAERRSGPPPPHGQTAWLIGLKLLAQPAATWALATYAFHLAAAPTHMAVLIAALPTGTGPFMLAEFYDREAGITARVILLSTIAALATITAYLAAIG